MSELTEERLAEALRAIAVVAVPDRWDGCRPAALSDRVDEPNQDEGPDDGLVASRPPATSSHDARTLLAPDPPVDAVSGRRTAWQPRLRTLAIAGAVAATAAAASGIAAASGAFSTRVQVVRSLAGPAVGLVSPTAGHSTPGETRRLVAQGPDGAVLTVLTASRNATGGCLALVVSDPSASAPPLHGGFCTGTYGPDSPIAPHNSTAGRSEQAPYLPTQTTFENGSDRWTSPTGAAYEVQYGEGPPGTTSVGLVTPGGALVGPRFPCRARWFAFAAPASELASPVHLAFFDANGATIEVTPSVIGLGPSPGGRG